MPRVPLALRSLLGSYVSSVCSGLCSAQRCRGKGTTVSNWISRRLWLFLTLQRMSAALQPLCISKRTRYCATTEAVFAMTWSQSVQEWSRSDGYYWCLHLCSQPLPAESGESCGIGDCMKGRIRFITAITAAFAYPDHVICLTRLCGPESEISFASCQSQMSDFHGWAIFIDGSTCQMVCAVERSHHGRCHDRRSYHARFHTPATLLKCLAGVDEHATR